MVVNVTRYLLGGKCKQVLFDKYMNIVRTNVLNLEDIKHASTCTEFVVY